jgi:hypothetical protein
VNYGELKAALAGYLHRSNLTSEIIEFITRAEQRIGRDVRILENRVQDTVTPVSGVAALPTRLAELRRISTGSGNSLRILQSISPNEADRFASLSGAAAVFYLSDSIYLLPAADTDIDIDYYEYPETLVGALDSATRPILDRYENLYINAAMAEASLFTQDREAFAMWGNLYDAEVKAANRAANLADRPRATTSFRLGGRAAQGL